jgi:hypothetical protein
MSHNFATAYQISSMMLVLPGPTIQIWGLGPYVGALVGGAGGVYIGWYRYDSGILGLLGGVAGAFLGVYVWVSIKLADKKRNINPAPRRRRRAQ